MDGLRVVPKSPSFSERRALELVGNYSRALTSLYGTILKIQRNSRTYQERSDLVSHYDWLKDSVLILSENELDEVISVVESASMPELYNNLTALNASIESINSRHVADYCQELLDSDLEKLATILKEFMSLDPSPKKADEVVCPLFPTTPTSPDAA